MISVGFGKALPQDVIERLFPERARTERPRIGIGQAVKRALGLEANRVEVAGVRDGMVTLAKCCSPVLGEGIVVTIITSLREYPNMLLRRVSPIREALTGDALNCTVEAKQVRIVDSEIVDVPEPEEQRGEGEQNRGRRSRLE